MKHGGYDHDAWRSIQDLERKSQTIQGREYLRRPRIYDMELRRPESSRTPLLQARYEQRAIDDENDLIDTIALDEAEQEYNNQRRREEARIYMHRHREPLMRWASRSFGGDV